MYACAFSAYGCIFAAEVVLTTAKYQPTKSSAASAAQSRWARRLRARGGPAAPSDSSSNCANSRAFHGSLELRFPSDGHVQKLSNIWNRLFYYLTKAAGPPLADSILVQLRCLNGKRFGIDPDSNFASLLRVPLLAGEPNQAVHEAGNPFGSMIRVEHVIGHCVHRRHSSR